MANDKKFIVKNGLTAQNISFVDNIQSTNNTITVTMLGTDTLSFSGNTGQLFSITDSMTGTIFAVNDISGVPSIEVDDDGTVRIAEFDGNVLIGTATDNTINKLQVDGSVSALQGLYVNGVQVINSSAQWVGSPYNLQGIQGIQGRQGIQGIQGTTGAQGTTGQQGVQGIQGTTGAQGTTGQQGVQGIQGIQGRQGIQGIQGTTGAQGTTGQQGIQGIQGTTGAQGTTGQQGVQGIQGTTGAQGTTGQQGIQGIQGTQGTTGAQGTTGQQGVQGIQGTQGTTGAQGTTGQQGVQGIQGTQGSQGIQGATGPSTQINATDDTTTNASFYPVFVAATGSNQTATASSTKFYFNPSTGRLNATEFNALSDAAMKMNLLKLVNALDTINKVNGYQFEWIENGEISYGVIAQEIEELIPEIVSTTNEGFKSVNYAAIIPFIIEAIKMLTKRIEELENKAQ